MSTSAIKLDNSWLEHLQPEFDQAYMIKLKQFLLQQKKRHTVYPPGNLIFNALNTTTLNKIRVVILGQDPYHGPGQAHGLSFSVEKNIAKPPSLVNIFKEIKRDLGIHNVEHGNLTSWAEQGVLLLNSVLTVNHGQAASHQGQGWEQFTDKIITIINEKKQHIVFMLWGSYAHKKGAHIDITKHLVLKTTHPSPLSAHRGFLGCGHFSKCNQYLKSHNYPAIDWSITT